MELQSLLRTIDPNTFLISVFAAGLLCLAIISTREYSRRHARRRRMASTLANAVRGELL
jgi:hypothetical protein